MNKAQKWREKLRSPTGELAGTIDKHIELNKIRVYWVLHIKKACKFPNSIECHLKSIDSCFISYFS